MRTNIRNFLEETAKHCSLKDPLVEIGSYTVKGQEELANLRPIFPNNEYIGTDMRTGPGVDRIENVEYLNFKDNSLGGIICIDTIQCVRDIWKAKLEINRTLAKDGILFIASAMNAPYNIQYFYNYWRFTPKGFDVLMEDFPHRVMFMQGGENNPHTIIGIASKTAEVIRPLQDSAFISAVHNLEKEPFYPYDVNNIHKQILAENINNAGNV